MVGEIQRHDSMQCMNRRRINAMQIWLYRWKRWCFMQFYFIILWKMMRRVSQLKSLKCIIKLHPISSPTSSSSCSHLLEYTHTHTAWRDAKVITKGRSVQLKKVLSLTFLRGGRESSLLLFLCIYAMPVQRQDNEDIQLHIYNT